MAAVPQVSRALLRQHQPSPPATYFNEAGHIELSISDRNTLNRLAYCYYLWTVARFTVTSGTRTPREQAEAMYDNWYYHRSENIRYRNQVAEAEIRAAYDANVTIGRRNATIDAMTAVIENQFDTVFSYRCTSLGERSTCERAT